MQSVEKPYDMFEFFLPSCNLQFPYYRANLLETYNFFQVEFFLKL